MNRFDLIRKQKEEEKAEKIRETKEGQLRDGMVRAAPLEGMWWTVRTKAGCPVMEGEAGYTSMLLWSRPN